MPKALPYISLAYVKQGVYTPPRVADLRLPQALKGQVYHLSLPVLSIINLVNCYINIFDFVIVIDFIYCYSFLVI